MLTLENLSFGVQDEKSQKEIIRNLNLTIELSLIHILSNAFGMMYNQELFDQAGISAMPATFTELEAACEKLAAAGIQPFTNGYKEWWVYKLSLIHI